MRLVLLSALLLVGCHKKAPAGADLSPAYKFLPAKPDVVIRLDAPQLRAWPKYAAAAPVALRRVQKMLDATKRVCNLDLIAEARTIVIARTGSLTAGDTAVVVTGLAKQKVNACLVTLQTSDTDHLMTLDGDLFHVKALASGAILPDGEVVFVTRGGKGIEPAAWRTEVGAPAGAAPAWWDDLDPSDPVALRVATETKTAAFSANLGEPLVIKGKVSENSEKAAENDLRAYKAIVEYMKQADAGVARLELAGNVIHADLTATGDQVDRLLNLGLPALVGTGGEADVSSVLTDANAPRDCGALAGAVERYLKAGITAAGDNGKGEMETIVAKVRPKLVAAFVEHCAADGWSASSIACHVANAEMLGRFEKCRNDLTDEQRKKLDQAVGEATTGTSP